MSSRESIVLLFTSRSCQYYRLGESWACQKEGSEDVKVGLGYREVSSVGVALRQAIITCFWADKVRPTQPQCRKQNYCNYIIETLIMVQLE
jgi:hypothetical protein